jgi:hypothetical protein
MPWTRRQVKKLLSSGSPLTGAQKDKMKAELHADPAMGHAKKGSAELKKSAPNFKGMHGSASSYDFRRPKQKLLKRSY